MLNDLLVDDLVHDLEPFHRFLFHHSDVLLLKRNWTKRVVKVEETSFLVLLFLLHTEELPDVFVVGKSGAQANQTYILLCSLYVTDDPTQRYNISHFIIHYIMLVIHVGKDLQKV